jgi:hypothetical protein
MIEDKVLFKAKALFWTVVLIGGTQYLFPGSPLVAQERREENFALLISPQIVKLGENLRILAASELNIAGAEIVVTGPSGRLQVGKTRSGGGPPFWWRGEAQTPEEGLYTVALVMDTKSLAFREFKVPAPKSERTKNRGIWPTEGVWNRAAENLYSAWLDSLFQDADERASWKALHAVTQDRERNILHNSLSLGEDDPGGKTSIVMEPDCADAPYFLRAYFAWKMRLPFGFHECTRGSLQKAPECRLWLSNSVEAGPRAEAQAFNYFLRLILNAIHSGSARTLLESENSDCYPVLLTREDLRPGVVFADPYGHTLVLVRWLPQTAGHPGQLFAVDAQPDGTIGLRRFWQGNFLFNTANVIGNPGFKAFRPIIQSKGMWRPMTNDEIRESPDYANFSLHQKNMESSEFYDLMDRLINPEPLDPVTAFLDLFTAFHEQLVTRVLSVANSEEYKAAHPGAVIPMPNGAAVFQDVGLWEDYSTPNRDMRLLIAMDSLLEFPEKIIHSPQSYRYPKNKTPEQVKTELEELHQKWAREMTITYARSNGTPRTLTVEEILERKAALEMAYNPNDCIEIRWGAPEGSEELSTCRRRAPASQQDKMKSLRHWFREHRRPPT